MKIDNIAIGIGSIVQKIGNTLTSSRIMKVMQVIFMIIMSIWIFYKFSSLFGGIAERKKREKFKRLEDKKKKNG